MAVIDLSDSNTVEKSFTKRCVQYMWGATYYFPRCPDSIGINPLEAYFKNLKKRAIFAYNDDSPKLIIVEFVRIKNNSVILLLCEREGVMCESEGFKPWLIAEITFENNFFVHSNLGSYFEKDEADKEFCFKQGREETVHNIIDFL
ncbi:Uncharacterised protein [Legionella donaldsonii]|uniref:Uncharacterized protein n=1 Tax=Legionella donaldsonii TaxID=45060 RepID=A0A378J9X5_9GAMM|nr:hypothetical protein [Legionella donaldsonii]STX43938.1 Uncharacterised protein [Legionella donaldsonii]